MGEGKVRVNGADEKQKGRTAPEENSFHLFHVFYSARDSSREEEIGRNINKGKRKKCSEINLKHSNQHPFDFRDIDVGMSVAKGSSDVRAGKK